MSECVCVWCDLGNEYEIIKITVLALGLIVVLLMLCIIWSMQ